MAAIKRIAKSGLLASRKAVALAKSRRKENFGRYEVASFDMFDTLVTRMLCKPGDVFDVVEARATKEGLSADGFRDARQNAEKHANSLFGYSASIDQIYESFPADFCGCAHLSRLQEIEREVEVAVCVPKREGMALYEAAREAGCRIAVVSDMYLPSSTLAEILCNCGYRGWDLLLVSCEHGSSKADGGLYDILKKWAGCEPSLILHTGDNLGNDIGQAERGGLAARFMGVRDCGKPTGLADSFVRAANFCRADATASELAAFGYRSLGPVLVGFCAWLAERVGKRGFDRIVYLARDSRVLQQSMEILGYEVPKDTYLYVSRKSLRVPAYMASGSVSELLAAIDLPREITLSDLLLRLGFSQADVERAVSRFDMDFEGARKAAELGTDEEFHAVLEFLRNHAVDAPKALDNLTHYLEQQGLGGKIALVDIGWTGNNQVSLERVLEASGADADLQGFYMGVWPKSRYWGAFSMSGYLFDGEHGDGLWRKERSYHRFFETLFTDESGTTLTYGRRADGKVTPLFGGYGGTEAELGRNTAEVRRGALEFVKDWRRVFGEAAPQVAPDLAMHEMNRTFLNPTMHEAEFFGCWDLENEGELAKAAQPEHLSFYATHPASFVSDYRGARWHIGFLKRALKVPLPYARMLGLDAPDGGR